MTLVATMWQTLVSDATAAGNAGSRTFAGCCDNRRAETNWLPSLPLERIIMVQRAMWNGLPCSSEGLCWNQWRFIRVWMNSQILSQTFGVFLLFGAHITWLGGWEEWVEKRNYKYVLVMCSFSPEKTRSQSSRGSERRSDGCRAQRAAD